MAKITRKPVPRSKSPIQTKPVSTVRTHQGGVGYERSDVKSELFLLAVSNMVGEDTVYEKADERDARYVGLLHAATAEDADWVRRFLPWLRDSANMRTASIVGVAEYIRAGGTGGRQLVAQTLIRPDEPAELVSYFRNLGVSIPKPVKRGISDALPRLYTERNTVKYDGHDKPMRFGDVIELVHPAPSSEASSVLYKHLVDRAHAGASAVPVPMVLTHLRKAREVFTNENATAEDAAEAGLNWEAASGKGAMDAKAWEAQIPTMGYMALLRNLRNFTEAGISRAAEMKVISRLQDPEEVATSRQFPFRFFSAFKELGTMTYSSALEQAINLSCDNVPVFKGSTLIMVDASGSMNSRAVSAKSKMTPAEIACIFGTAIAIKNVGTTRMFGYTTHASMEFTVDRRNFSILGLTEDFKRLLRPQGTSPWYSVDQVYQGEDRVIFITDEQASDDPRHFTTPHDHAQIFVWNLGGYAYGQAGGPKVHTFGGFTDKMFTVMEMADRGLRGDWPF
jgi:hypothetical protein